MSPVLLAIAVLAGLFGRPFAFGSDVVIVNYSRTAEMDFLEGVEARADAAIARPHFADAASLFDSRGAAGERTPSLALNRGRAHFLAGQVPQAIRAFRDGLELFPWDAELQRDLAAARATVAYPAEPDPASRVRPDPPASLRHRLSPWDLFLAATLFALVVAVGLARRFTTADRWAAPLAATGLVGLLLVAVAAWKIDAEARSERDHPVVVLAADVVLRTGNGTAFPARLGTPLPRGAEVRQLTQRGGWVQVQLPGGAIGWVPEAAVLGPPSIRVNPFLYVRD
jgi:hypothetical protein